ncbi:hypothetical protein AMK01_CH01152 [Rhizobium sp. N6212]|nr:hypothetical protein AMK01_CH01152 [Rhizobium sp. N6212]ANK96689.1 hypothetical protein AMK00_CH01154 [Rhizobium sp. N621]ANL02809.1 hypothetical protein AMJ99_CH01222 [Rhizobium esperanzae]ANL08858.1 hypothetical protein AMJ98_CH01143 [Rhizobium sp. N1341]ANL20905.1 hypothetical protein AMJ96_CH01146 [Rhizobium sp. N113]ANM33662.1 hypothetical protein AMK04_CH01224 [Rhizobium sp. N871]ANM39699.1 hypothetical protein AMK03_CH01143 [Rhizobium sp. N741]
MPWIQFATACASRARLARSLDHRLSWCRCETGVQFPLFRWDNNFSLYLAAACPKLQTFRCLTQHDGDKPLSEGMMEPTPEDLPQNFDYRLERGRSVNGAKGRCRKLSIPTTSRRREPDSSGTRPRMTSPCGCPAPGRSCARTSQYKGSISRENPNKPPALYAGKQHQTMTLPYCLTFPPTGRQLALDELTLLPYLNISINLNTSRPVTSYFHDR